MGVVLKFPVKVVADKEIENLPTQDITKTQQKVSKKEFISSKIIHLVWIITMLLWPFLRWFIAIDVAFYGFMTALAWDTPDSHYGVKFVVHLLFFSVFIYFVTNHKENK